MFHRNSGRFLLMVEVSNKEIAMSVVEQLERMLQESRPQDTSWKNMQKEFDEMLTKGLIKKQGYDLAPLQVSAPSTFTELQAMLHR